MIIMHHDDRLAMFAKAVVVIVQAVAALGFNACICMFM